jgi:hypothetical protein
MLNRGVFIAAMSVLATGSWFAADAAAGGSNSSHTVTNHEISETHKFNTIGSHASAGSVDGRIGATSVHGAFRSHSQTTGPLSEIVRGTEFDGRGSRSFVFHDNFSVSNGQVTINATGRWTGGTGAYQHARGNFKITGTNPIGGVQTSHLTGSIIY